MNIRLKTSILFVIVFFAVSAFAQSKKLVKSFKLGVVGYSLYETSIPSKAKNDTVFYSLFKAGKPKRVAKEVKSITNKSTGEKLMTANYAVNKNSIVFAQNWIIEGSIEKTYTQGKNGLLSVSTKKIMEAENVIAAAPPSKVSKPIGNDHALSLEVDEQPQFPGGLNAFRQFLAKSIIYPDEAVENGIQGNVYTTFIIEKDGRLTNIEIEKKVGYGFDEEVIRVLKRSPKWIPAKLKGNAVRCSFRLPVFFNLNQ